MTRNQIEYQVLKENQRANRARERETERYNKAVVAERDRHNTATRVETQRSNLAREHETTRSNLQRELNDNQKLQADMLKLESNHYLTLRSQDEAMRHNKATEKVAGDSLDFNKQDSFIKNALTARHIATKERANEIATWNAAFNNASTVIKSIPILGALTGE